MTTTTATTSYWNPFADVAALAESGRVTIVRGEGSTVWDDAGTAYLDAIASLWYCNVGHGRAEIADAAAEQIRTLAAYQTFERYTTPATEALSAKVASLTHLPDAKVFFTSGGSESIDTAAKLVRAYWRAVGHPDKEIVLSREHAYHGMNAYGTSLAGIPSNLDVFHPLVPTVERVAWDDAATLRAAIDRRGPDRVGAFFCEPVIGAGGVIAPPEGYLQEIQAICRDADVLFIADEVVSGFGRLGDWFASERYGIDPDMITAAKGLTSGYAPLGAVIVGPRVCEPFWSGTGAIFRHGYTYSGHTACCAIGLANLEIIEREGLRDRVRELEPVLDRILRPLEAHPLVSEVRAGVGLLGAVELDAGARAEDPGLLNRVVAGARERGVLTRGIRGVALQVSPPFVVTEAELEQVAAAFAGALDAAAAG